MIKDTLYKKSAAVKVLVFYTRKTEIEVVEGIQLNSKIIAVPFVLLSTESKGVT